MQNIQELINDGAIFFVSHSGGKDSQAMYNILSRMIPHNQIVVVHADLGKIEHEGVQAHIKANISHELNVVRAQWKDGSEKTLLGMVERRIENRPDAAPWPSSSARFCTSDLKRDPIHKFIRQEMKRREATIGVNCTGIRAEEGGPKGARAKMPEFEECKRLKTQARTVYEWRPIHKQTITEVFAAIHDEGQKAFHIYYGENVTEKAPFGGNERLSCVFCIMGCSNDLRNGAKARPELAQEYVEIERRTGRSMFHKHTLESVVGDLIATDAI